MKNWWLFVLEALKLLECDSKICKTPGEIAKSGKNFVVHKASLCCVVFCEGREVVRSEQGVKIISNNIASFVLRHVGIITQTTVLVI